MMSITHFSRGSGLISTNNNNIAVEFKASELEQELITTDRYELSQLLHARACVSLMDAQRDNFPQQTQALFACRRGSPGYFYGN